LQTHARLLFIPEGHRIHMISRIYSDVSGKQKMKTKRIVLIVLSAGIITYIGTYAYLYSIQDEQGSRFKGHALPTDFKFSFKERFEELSKPKMGEYSVEYYSKQIAQRELFVFGKAMAVP